MKIRDYVEVRSQPTVVRLEHLQGEDPQWITDGYYITEETARHFKALRALFAKETGCGAFLIGHYGSGKSHFLAYLSQRLAAGRFDCRRLDVLPLSLLNFKASQPLEEILDGLLSIESGRHDRRGKWRQMSERHPKGLVLVLDELSEFLRSKPTSQSFNEDLRFLQFLGEWAQDNSLWIIAALQEQIEHTGEIEYDLFRKIKDRYPIRLLLTTSHVKDLISQRILQKKASYAPAVENLAAQLKEVYPDASIDYGLFCEIYPIHPVTLELLEEVRDCFSQARGIVDFAMTRLLGNESRGASPFLDQPWGHLLTPDAIVDHFEDLFKVQPEFLAIAQKVLPYFRKHIPSLFGKELQQELAWRLLKLLVLVHLSPRRKSLSADEAAEWLLFRISSIDLAKNRQIVGKALETLCRQGAFVKREGSSYALDLEHDGNEYLEQLLSRTIDELKTRGDSVFENLVPLLEGEPFNPFGFPRDRWFVRKVRWHFHDWDMQVCLGAGDQTKAPKQPSLQIGIPWGPPAAASGCYKILPKPLELDSQLLELSALQDLKDRPLSSRVLSRIRERVSAHRPWFCSLVRAAYGEANVIDQSDSAASQPLSAPRNSHTGWLNAYGEWILRRTYPLFEQFAPAYGPLPKEAYRQFMKFASEQDLGAADAPEYVRVIREAYLVPMGLMQRRGSEYFVNHKLDGHDLVRSLIPILEHHPSPERVYQHLGAPVYGLVPDQIHLLLIMLLVQGEIDIVKEGHSYRDVYETLIHPLQYDKILPGRALNLNQLHDLQALCEGFRITLPRQWSVLAQKRAVEHLRRIGAKQRDQLSEFVTGLKGQAETGDLVDQAERLICQWLALEKGEHELHGFQHFLFAIGSPQRFAAEANELASMPARFERLMRESRRYCHLFGYPHLSQCADPGIAARTEALGKPPSLTRMEALEEWLRAAQLLYRDYREWYRTQHERAWKNAGEHPILNYSIPNVSRSKHVANAGLLRLLESIIAEAKAARCTSLGSLDFQPFCRCGFDGFRSPLSEILSRFEEASSRLENDLASFFQQDQVKAKVKEWVDQGFEMNTKTLSYLEGKSVYPEIEQLTLFDQHLSGLELVQRIETKPLMEFLGERVWDKPALKRAFAEFIDRFGPRISFHREQPATRAALVAWCCEQALKQGCPFPKGFSASDRSIIHRLIQPQWVSEQALLRLEELDLDEAAILRILGMLLDGAVAAPSAQPSDGAVAAALDLLNPRKPADADELARLVTCLYQQSPRFIKLQPQLWLSHLQRVAEVKLETTPEQLNLALQSHINAQWVIIDCLGLPLAKSVEEILPKCLPDWKLDRVEYALVSEHTSTEAFYLGLIGGDLTKPFEKINVIDTLIHGRRLSLNDLAKLVCAELDVAFRKRLRFLDPQLPLLIFGDHGFRLSADGAGFSHGGASTVERIIPLFDLRPVV